MNPIQIVAEKPNIAPEIIFNIGSFPVTNSLIMTWLIILIIIAICFFTSKKLKLKPGSKQNIIEILYQGIYGLIDQTTGDKKYTKKLLYLIAPLFIFIGLANLLGIIIPFLSSITYKGMSVFRTPTTDFNITVSLALAMILLIQWVSIRKRGLFSHFLKYFQFHEIIKGFGKGINAGIMGIINFILGLMDIITEFARIISLSVRLFGNIFAGETLAIIILGGLAYILPSVWMAMNLFTGTIQAMVFGCLTTAYYMLAVKETE
ncbi:MAG: F0F1 ATP synthase subunit A [Patescibacteria group bacterium]|nr:F0F1 ATP synthase subunit A [Patescibacteria group bacterium]